MTDVMHVISGLGIGGAESMLVDLAIGLRARGLSQHVVSLRGLDAHADELRAAGIDVTVLSAGKAASLPGAAFGLLRAVAGARPRVLQGWMYHGNVAATLCHYLCRGRRARALLWNLRASNMDEVRYGRLVRVSALLSGAPELVVANSEAGAAYHREAGFHPPRMLVIDNGIDTDRFRPDPGLRAQARAALGIADNAIVAIHVARVDAMKDHATFLEAMARVPEITGILVGSGTDALSPPANVRGLGMRRDTAQLFTAADIVASTSAFGEGFPNVIAEGMSVGLVPLATDVGDAKRIIGDSGFVVAPRDPEAFAQVLAALVAMPEDERVRRGLEARNRVVAHFALERAVERYFALYTAPAPSGSPQGVLD